MKFKIYFLALFNFIPVLIFAQNGLGIENPISATNLWDVVISMVKIVRTIAIPFVVLAIMYTGFLFIKAQGKAEEIASARKAFFWTMIAAFIILSAESLGEMLKNTIIKL
jgi:hypothetical protein